LITAIHHERNSFIELKSVLVRGVHCGEPLAFEFEVSEHDSALLVGFLSGAIAGNSTPLGVRRRLGGG
jgi:hypothetical protein